MVAGCARGARDAPREASGGKCGKDGREKAPGGKCVKPHVIQHHSGNGHNAGHCCVLELQVPCGIYALSKLLE